MKKYSIITFITLIFVIKGLYSEENDFWMYLKMPEIGEVLKIKEHPNGDIYILSNGNGWFSSSDRGNNWDRLTSTSLFDVNSNNEMIELKHDYNSVTLNFSYSSDRGKSWETRPMPKWLDYGLSIFWTNHDTISVISINESNLETYITIDKGRNWSFYKYNYAFLGNSLTRLQPRFTEFLPQGIIAMGGHIENFGEEKDFLLISFDSGQSWNIKSDLPPVYNFKIYIDSLFIISTYEGLYFSTDAGRNWFIKHPKTYFRNIDIDQNGNMISSSSLGVFFSTNFGDTWEKLLTTQVNTFLFCKDTNLIFGGGIYGIYISSDKGHTWTRSNKGFSAADIVEMAEDSSGNLFAISHPGGIYKSSDNGLTWNYLGLENHYLNNIAIKSNDYIFVGRDGYPPEKLLILRSTDGGDSWEDKSNGIYTAVIDDIFITKKGYIMINGMHISTDNGDSWIWQKEYDYANCYAYNSDGYLFYGGYQGIFYRSTDEGDTWEKMRKLDKFELLEIYKIMFSPYSQVGFALGYSIDGYICYKTTDNGLYWLYCDNCPCDVIGIDSLRNFIRPWTRSLDPEGVEWSGMLTGLKNDYFNSIFTSHNGYTYLAAKNGGLYRSRDRYVSVPETQEPPGSRDGLSASPNPFSDKTSIDFSLDVAGEVTISLYDMLGRQVADIFHGYRDEGRHSVQLLITNYELPMNPGVYFIRLETQKEVLVSKVIIIK